MSTVPERSLQVESRTVELICPNANCPGMEDEVPPIWEAVAERFIGRLWFRDDDDCCEHCGTEGEVW